MVIPIFNFQLSIKRITFVALQSHNRKLRDCRIHFSDAKNERKEESSIFITEGDSASGSITKSRDVNTQAVFSLRGKPLNCYGLTKKVVYENEEFNLLQAALDIEDGLDGLRYAPTPVLSGVFASRWHIAGRAPFGRRHT